MPSRILQPASLLSRMLACPRGLAIVACASFALLCAATANCADIPWDTKLKYSRTSVDDDLRNVLRSLLKANGLSAVFGPGVDARVSFQFQDAPPSVVFAKLLAAHNLSYAYDPAAKIVTISANRLDESGPEAQRFLALQHIDFETLRAALKRFGIDAKGLAYEPSLGLVSIRGNDAHVALVEKLVAALESRTVERERRYFEEFNRRRGLGQPLIEGTHEK